ncbi:ribonuclease H-like domain-containing protein [Tanacetum coccineum]
MSGESYGSVVLINNLDAGNPLHIQANDNSSTTLILFKLIATKNYRIWASAMKLALQSRNKYSFIDDVYMGLVYSENAADVWKELESTYDKVDGSPVKSALLTRDRLPEVKDAYTTVSREESHRGIPETSSATELKISATSFAAKLQNCNANVDFKNNDKQSSVSVSSLGFTSEQMQKLLSFINDNTTGSVHANMAGMFDVIDITSLKITVGHPNGTLATISQVGNLKLSNNVVLYDVLVDPGYYDLKTKKVLGTGSKSRRLYLFDMDKVNNVGKSNMVLCFNVSKLLWHNRAKQTRDPFPLSDHKSKVLGELIHLDLWGPYKVHNREGLRYFLTVVDDYSRAVWVYLVKAQDCDIRDLIRLKAEASKA